MTKLQIIAKAIEINGHLPVPVGGGRCVDVRSVTACDDGLWLTDALREDLCGHVRITKKGQPIVMRIARDIIAREAEITAGREARFAAAMGRDGEVAS